MASKECDDVQFVLCPPEDNPLSDESARAIRDVMEAAREKFMTESLWEVKAVVIARVYAPNQGAAMQELCNRLDGGVPEAYTVATVDALKVSAAALPGEQAPSIDEQPRWKGSAGAEERL